MRPRFGRPCRRRKWSRKKSISTFDVVAAIAQRRQVQLEHAEAIVQVFAKSFVADVLLQILIRGGDDAHIDADFLGRADGQERMAFQNSQQLGLAFQRQLADFVEKQRAQVGLLEEARCDRDRRR